MGEYPQYIVCWTNEGFESIIDIEKISKDLFFGTIKDPFNGITVNKKLRGILNILITRARFNPNRFYEIYALNAADGIKKKDIEDAFYTSPQAMADTVRKTGIKIYSSPKDNTKDVIQ